MIGLLLSKGASLASVDNEYNTALNIASKRSYIDCISTLIDVGASTGSRIDDRKYSLDQHLHIAATHGKPESVQELLRQGAAIESLDDLCNTPLMQAAISGRPLVVKILLDNGANVEAADSGGYRAIHLSAELNYFDVAKTLLQHHANCEAISNRGESPLHVASGSYSASIKMLQLLLDHGARISSMTTEGNLPIHEAAKKGRYDLVKVLLNRGAQIDAKGALGRSPIHLAAALQNSHTLPLLIERGARVNIATDNQESEDNCSYPIHIAAEEGLAKNVQLLINAGSELEYRNKWGHSPLHLACRNGDIDDVNTILLSGAHANAISYAGWSPLALAAAAGQPHLIDVLELHGAWLDWSNVQGNKLLHLVCENVKGPVAYQFAARLLGLGAEIDAIGSENHTALHKATLANDLKMAEMLVQRGANIYATTAENETPLQLAIDNGHQEIAELLVGQQSLDWLPEDQSQENAQLSSSHETTASEDLQGPQPTKSGAEVGEPGSNVETLSLSIAESALSTWLTERSEMVFV